MAASPRPNARAPGAPTMELVFVERVSEAGRTLLILHQKHVRQDGSFYFREVRRISTEKLERINREGAAPDASEEHASSGCYNL